MLTYFDKLFVRIYRLYDGYQGTRNDPNEVALFAISFFQLANVLGIIEIGVGIWKGAHWNAKVVVILGVGGTILLFNYIRIFRVKEVESLLMTYRSEESSKMTIPPFVYLALSVLAFVAANALGFRPSGTSFH